MAALTLARLVSVGALFAAGVVAARLLAPREMGAVGVGQTLAWVVAIVANGGLNIAVISLLRRARGERAAQVRRFVGLGLGAVAAALLVSALAAPLVAGAALDRAGPALLAGAAALAAATVGYEVHGSLLLGLGRRRSYVGADLLRSAVTLAAVGVLLAGVTRGAGGYLVALAAGAAVPAAVSLLVVRRTVGTVRPAYDAAFTARVLRLGLAGQAGNVLTALTLRLDLVLVPALLRLDVAGVYVVASRVADVVGQLSTAAAAMLFPQVASASGRRTATTERASRLTLLLTLAAGAVLAAAAGPLLPAVFGDGYGSGATALRLLLAAMVPMALVRVLSADLKGRGRPGLVSVGAGAGLAVTVLADLALIPRYGIAGAGAASVLAATAAAGALFGCYHRVCGGRLAPLLPGPGDARDLLRLVRSVRAARADRAGGPADRVLEA